MSTTRHLPFVSLLHKIYPSVSSKSLVPMVNDSFDFVPALTKIYGKSICPYCKNDTIVSTTDTDFRLKMRKSLECNQIRGEKRHHILP